MQHHIRLKTTHVTSCNNISDALSHGAINKFLTSFPSVNIHASILLIRQTDIIVAPILIPLNQSPIVQLSTTPNLSQQLISSPLHPHCRAEEHIFLWKGINTPPISTISDPTIELIVTLAAPLHDTSSYGLGL
jgi:hypothetical protein